MNIWLYYTLIQEELPPAKWEAYLAHLPKAGQEKAGKFHRWQDAHAYVIGQLLILRGLAQLGHPGIGLESLQTNAFGRPWFDLDFDFNISHSGEMVACAFSDQGRLGLDLEEIKPIQLSDFESFFTPDEMQLIQEAHNPMRAFYWLWTIKESVMKADGRGLSLPPQNIKITEDRAEVEGATWQIKSVFIETGYSIHLASDKLVTTVVSDRVELMGF